MTYATTYGFPHEFSIRESPKDELNPSTDYHKDTTDSIRDNVSYLSPELLDINIVNYLALHNKNNWKKFKGQ